MRLINTNEIKNSLLTELLMVVDGGTDASYLKTYEVIDRIEKIVNEWVDNAPTVEAIPIDWIEKNGKRYYMGEGYDTIWDCLEDWEKENERRWESERQNEVDIDKTNGH